jgi:hypothetical protein
MMIGVAGDLGSRKCDRRMNTGTAAPLPRCASHVDATPSCSRPVGITSRTTAHVMCTEAGCGVGEEEME